MVRSSNHRRISPILLPRMKSRSIFLMELTRIAVNQGGFCRFDQQWVYEELARRGVLSKIKHFERSEGATRPTTTSRVRLSRIQQYGLDLGIFKEWNPPGKGYVRHIAVTPLGRITLENWDDPTGDGLHE